MNIKFKKNSISSKILINLILFSIFLLLFLWLIQIVFFRVFYEKYQINYLESLVQKIGLFNENEIFDDLENLNLDNDICLEYVDSHGNSYYYNDKISTCLLGKDSAISDTIRDIKTSEKTIEAKKLINPLNNSVSLLYGIKVGSGYIFLFSALEDIGTTTSLLKGQLIYVTLLAILFSMIISIFLSQKIADPIINITSKAKRIADGDYDVYFEESGIAEIDDLSKTLNYMEKEVSKTDEYRRDLMANVSHDLKTPLTMIKAYAEMVRDISYNDTERRNKHLNVIIEEADRLNYLVNDILELSKIQANKTELNLEEFDLVAELENILKRYDIIKETENYKILTEIPSQAIVKADKKKINQVLYNLINNAINYTGDDLTVKIKIRENKKNYLVEVIDSGKGIKSEDLINIWDKYYKKEKNHKRNIVGTGLGLSIVKGILEAHNFKFGVRTKLKKGTNFYFYINKP